ncbi:MAG: hypothetical protein ACYCWA_00320 [Thiobacillus sp.]
MRPRTLTPLAVLATLAASPAHAGAMTGGATEITQIMNNIELVMQVGEAVETTSNTLMTAQSTMQQLRQLPQSVTDSMNGPALEKVRAMADAYRVMSQAQGVYKDAENVLRKAAADSERLGITPSELLRLKADAAYKHGGVYKETYEQEQEALRRLAETSKDVQKQANAVKGIDANVKGIQFLATQNVQMQTTLAGIHGSIAKANANAAAEAANEARARGDVASAASELEDVRRKNARTPDAALRMPWEQIKK